MPRTAWSTAYSVEAGGGEHVQVLRLSAQKDWNKNWLPTSGYHLSGYWDANIAYWRANQWLDQPGNRHNLAVIGMTPVFRWEADDKLGFYADAGIGAALFSDVYRNTHRQLSTALNSPTISAPATCSRTNGSWARACSIIRMAASSIRMVA
jgi:hypothetical protein